MRILHPRKPIMKHEQDRLQILRYFICDCPAVWGFGQE
jgi:hypothetical protein